VLEATYGINVELHESFFEAYVDALERAIRDHVVRNLALVSASDAVYHETIERKTALDAPESLGSRVSTA